MPVHLTEIDDEVKESGRLFAARWVKRLRTQGHLLSIGDVTNMAHAGAVITAFAASQGCSKVVCARKF
jgi:hypothetical protein